MGADHPPEYPEYIADGAGRCAGDRAWQRAAAAV